MEKELAFIASSDWHLHNFQLYTENLSRLKWGIKAGKHIMDRCKYNKVPHLFAGDLFHTPKEVQNEVTTKVKLFYKREAEDNDIEWFAIPGNHDMSQKNTKKHKSPHYLEEFMIFKSFHNVSDTIIHREIKGNEYLITGIPYYNYERDLVEEIKKRTKEMLKIYNPVSLCKRILMLHNNAPGAASTTGHVIEDCKLPKDLDEFFKDWDLVLFGHIHLGGKLSNKCYMLGSPIHQIRADEGHQMGYWEVYTDLSMKFVSMNNQFPEFKTFKNAKEFRKHKKVCKKTSIDYIQIVPEEKPIFEDEQSEGDFEASSSRSDLAKSYCSKHNIRDKQKINALKSILNQV